MIFRIVLLSLGFVGLWVKEVLVRLVGTSFIFGTIAFIFILALFMPSRKLREDYRAELKSWRG